MTSFRLSVCPHDTARNITGWFLFDTYLQRKLDCAIRFEPKDNFIEERNSVLNGGYQIAYANPFSAAIYAKRLGFLPVAKPGGVFDETMLVSKGNAQIPSSRPLRIASATDKLIIHSLGLSLLGALNISPSDCEFVYVGTHAKAAHALIEGTADLGFVYNETWKGMADSSSQALTVVSQTSSQQAYHCFCVAPEWKEKLEQLQALLVNMLQDPQGKGILDDIHLPAGFEPMAPDDLLPFIELVARTGDLD